MQCQVPTLRVIQHGAGIPILRCNSPPSSCVGLMYRRALDISQLGHPFSYILSIWIEPFALKEWIEDSKVRLRIHPGTRSEPPPAMVGRKVPINESLHKVSLATAPVEKQILRQKRRNNHTRPVVHPFVLFCLSHGGVHYGEACFPLSRLSIPTVTVSAIIADCH